MTVWDKHRTLEAIQQRAQFLRDHPRITPPQFPRDFIAEYGFGMLLQIERFDAVGVILCTPQALGHPAGETERKRLQRMLKRLVAEGQIEQMGRSEYRLTSE